MRRGRGEAGSITGLLIGSVLLLAAFVGLAVDGTRLFIARRDLQTLADSAALAGASSIDESRYRTSGGLEVVIDPAAARFAAAGVVSTSGWPPDGVGRVVAVVGEPGMVVERAGIAAAALAVLVGAAVPAVAQEKVLRIAMTAAVLGLAADAPTTIDGLADGAIAFIRALGLTQVDVLGWSLGGIVAQIALAAAPGRFTHAALMGTTPPGPIVKRAEPLFAQLATKPVNDAEDQIALFFEPASEASRAAAAASRVCEPNTLVGTTSGRRRTRISTAWATGTSRASSSCNGMWRSSATSCPP